jgi:hypothetical protein
MRASFVAALVLCSAVSAAAQVIAVNVTPASATTLDRVVISVTATAPCTPVTFQRTGNVIRIDVPSTCVVVLPPIVDAHLQIGFLPAGAYTYNIFVDGSLDRSGSFVVAEAGSPFVPALSPQALAALALALAMAGWIVARRT